MLEVMRRVMDGETETPPEWGDLDLIETTVWGLKHAVIILVFYVVALAIAAVPVALFAGVGTTTDSDIFLFLGILVGGLLFFAGSFVLAVVVPVATGNFIRTGTIGAAFDFDVLVAVVPNRTMIEAVLYAFLVNILFTVAVNVLGFTIIGYLAVPFVAFVTYSAMFYLWAKGFADAYEEEYGQRPTVPDGPLKPGVTVGGDDAAGTVSQSPGDNSGF
jgi:hypothetical protein